MVASLENSIREIDNKLVKKSEHEFHIKNQTLSKYLIKLQEKIKQEKRIWIYEQAKRLGRPSGNFTETWEDGEEIKAVKKKLDEVRQERDHLDKMKKKKKNNKRKLERQDTFACDTNPNAPIMDTPVLQSFHSFHDIELSYDESEFTGLQNGQPNYEQKEILNYKVDSAKKQEARLKEEL